MQLKRMSSGKVVGWALFLWFLACPAIYYLIWQLPTKPYALLPAAWIGGITLSTIGPILGLAALLSLNLVRAFLYLVFSPWGFVAIGFFIRSLVSKKQAAPQDISENMVSDEAKIKTQESAEAVTEGKQVMGIGKTVGLSLLVWGIFFAVIYTGLERMLYGFGGLFVLTSPLGIVNTLLSGSIVMLPMELMMFAISPYAFILYGLGIRRLKQGKPSSGEALSAADRYALTEKEDAKKI